MSLQRTPAHSTPCTHEKSFTENSWIRKEGLEIIHEPVPLKSVNNTIIGMAKDPDGYSLEIIQIPAKKY